MRKIIDDYAGLIFEIVMFVVILAVVIRGVTHMING